MWNKIFGNDKVKEILEKAISEERIASAYLFWGEDGVGQDALAVQFAKNINNNPNLVHWLSSPNIVFIHSLPTPKSTVKKNDGLYSGMSDDQMEIIKEELSKKEENPYYDMKLPNANQIKLNSIEHLKKFASSSVYDGKKIIIVSNADEMSIASSNSFLKTLEEPNNDTVIILTTSKFNKILPTIKSRCQLIKLSPIPDEAMFGYLKNNYKSNSEDEINLAVRLSQGSITKAEEILDSNIIELRDLMVNMLRAILKRGDYLDQFDPLLKEICSLKDKNQYIRALKILSFWLRDAIVSDSTDNHNLVFNIDNADSISKFSLLFSQDKVSKSIDEIEKAIIKLNRNVSDTLVFISLFLNIRNALYN